ncbi:MAG TPA: hypothetical protein P5534_14725, partial [Candidatus Paceibacterota bacterium]|nr:hypothetical protein [Candidatus Paceibacterota bacterium]
MIATAIALAVSTQAFEVPYSQPFSIGPGETAFAVQLPQFDPTAHPDRPVLESVTVTLDATFSGGMTFYNAAFTATGAQGTTETGRVLATPAGPSMLVPAALNLALSAAALVPAAVMAPDPDPSNSPPDPYRIDGKVPVAAQSSSASSIASTDPLVLKAYSGNGSVAYDIDYTARYPQFVTTAPSTLTAILCNDRVHGSISVVYSAAPSPPTAVVIEAFGASWTGPGRVVMHWRTAGKSNLLGFHVEREIGDGNWLRVTDAIIPAQGGTEPRTYRFEEANVTAPGEVRYRLLAIGDDGQTAVVDETIVVPGIQGGIEFTGAGYQ